MFEKKTVLITGGKGNLAKEICKYNSLKKLYNILSPSKIDLDVTNLENVYNFLSKCKIDYVIHAGAYTKPMNKHAKHPEISIQTNIIGTANVALGCLKYDCKLVYISTDYVYPGICGNYSEGDPLSPYAGSNDGINKYGWSKLGGECAVHILDNYLILRACLCDYPFPHPSALTDVKKSLIFHHEAAPLILQLLDYNGVINLGGESQSVHSFAKTSNPQINKLTRKDVKDVMIAPDTSMNTSRLKGIINGDEN